MSSRLSARVSRMSHFSEALSGKLKEPKDIRQDTKDRPSVKVKDELPDLDHPPVKGSIIFGIGQNIQVVNIHTVYDQNQQLAQLKFVKNSSIPRSVLKIISFIVPFHPYLTTIKIDRGANKEVLYELSHILSLSNLTEITLDGNVIREANYYILLEEHSSLKYLSLARCKINDDVVKLIAEKLLTCPLSLLNLASNRIMDAGATYLGNVLRTNRKLTYLNLSDNSITDTGAIEILNALMPFSLNADEVTEKKIRHFAYLKKRQDLVMKILEELRATEVEPEKKVTKKIAMKQVLVGKKKSKSTLKENETAIPPPAAPFLDKALLDKAEERATASLGPYEDPFSAENVVTTDGIVHCLGNNILCYLNLAYNNLTYFTVKKLCDVVSVQQRGKRDPKGLIKVCIDGNNMPEACPELTEIDYMLERGLANKMSTIIRKRPTVKLNMKFELKSTLKGLHIK